MKEILHKELSYRITGLFFQVQKELGRFCREKQYADRLEELLKENRLNYEREFEIRDTRTGRTTGNRIDFLIENKIIVDLKAKNFIFKDDYFQMQRYLRSLDLELGMIINFRNTHLKPKRVLNGENKNYKRSKSFQFGAFGFNSLNSDRLKGFSLLELTVAMAVVGILIAAVIVPLNNSRTKKEVEVAAREVAAAIREAQNYALTGKSTSAGYPCRYGFRADNTESGYYIDYYYATESCTILQGITQPYISYELKNGVLFSSDSGDFDFSVPWGVITANTFTLPARYVVSKGSSSYTVCVYSAGNITELPGGVACP